MSPQVNTDGSTQNTTSVESSCVFTIPPSSSDVSTESSMAEAQFESDRNRHIVIDFVNAVDEDDSYSDDDDETSTSCFVK